MNPLRPLYHFEPQDLLAVLRLCAHRLLIAYDETRQPELWHASEQAARACEYLCLEIAFQNKPSRIH